MVNKTADSFNNIVLVAKISGKNLLKKWKTTQRWKRSNWLQYNNTMFIQAFLLSQYSFICVQYFKCSDT